MTERQNGNKDNIHPYNRHWLRHWGTGEAGNNGTHDVDLCRWALGVDYPQSVVATGGRYALNDDQQFYDTLAANFDYGDKMITWEGRSSSGMKYYDHDSGLIVMGTTGSVFIYGDRGGIAGRRPDCSGEDERGRGLLWEHVPLIVRTGRCPSRETP